MLWAFVAHAQSLPLGGIPVGGGGGGGGTPTFIASKRVSFAGAGTGTSTATDCTGATLLALFVAGYQTDSTTLNITDSQGNTYTKGADAVGTNFHGSIWLKAAPSSTGLNTITWTIGATSDYTSVDAACFSGTSGAIDQQNHGGSTNGLATLQPGSITPTNSGSLVFTGIVFSNVATDTDGTTPIDSSFTLIQHTGQGTAGVGTAIAYKVVTGAINPTWKLNATGADRAAEQVSVNHN